MKPHFDIGLYFFLNTVAAKHVLRIVSQTALNITSKVQFQFHPMKIRTSTFSIIKIYRRSPLNEIVNVAMLRGKKHHLNSGQSQFNFHQHWPLALANKSHDKTSHFTWVTPCDPSLMLEMDSERHFFLSRHQAKRETVGNLQEVPSGKLT